MRTFWLLSSLACLWMLLLWPAAGWAQHLSLPAIPTKTTAYVDADGRLLLLPSGAYQRIETEYQDSVAATVRTYDAAGQLRSRKTYANLRTHLLQGPYTLYYPTGKLQRQEVYVNGQLHGPLRSYDDNGTLRRREEYTHGKRTSGACFDASGKPVPYQEYEQEAVYAGGNEQLLREIQRRVRYPKEALRAQITGKVFVSFLVDEQGNATDARVVHSPSPLLNAATLQAFNNLGKFTPARQDGQLVHAWVTCPLTFSISQSTTSFPRPAGTPMTPPAAQFQVGKKAPLQAVYKLVSFRDSFYHAQRKVPIVYQHYFTYDSLGRPLLHYEQYLSDGHVLSTDTMRYDYGAKGELLSKTSRRVHYTFTYSPAGELSGMQLAFRNSLRQWVISEETRIEHKATHDNGEQVYTMSFQKANQNNGLQLHSQWDYTLSAAGVLTTTTVYHNQYMRLAAPAVYNYTYDGRVNPVAGLFVERWYQFGLEGEGLLNLVEKHYQQEPFMKSQYTYNSRGYPTQHLLQNTNGKTYRVRTYAYAPIQVPAASSPGANAEASLAVYPNPATSQIILHTTGVSAGPAKLTVYSAATGQVQRRTAIELRAAEAPTFSVGGLPQGVYVVEVAGVNATVKTKLIVE